MLRSQVPTIHINKPEENRDFQKYLREQAAAQRLAMESFNGQSSKVKVMTTVRGWRVARLVSSGGKII